MGNRKRIVPKLVNSLLPFPISKVVCGGQHCVALTSRGHLFVWGSNAFGQLGLGDRRDRNQPTQIESMLVPKIKEIACGWRHSVAIPQHLECLYAWGASQLPDLSERTVNYDEYVVANCPDTESYISPKRVNFYNNMPRSVLGVRCSSGHSISCTSLILGHQPLVPPELPLFGTEPVQIESKREDTESSKEKNATDDDLVDINPDEIDITKLGDLTRAELEQAVEKLWLRKGVDRELEEIENTLLSPTPIPKPMEPPPLPIAEHFGSTRSPSRRSSISLRNKALKVTSPDPKTVALIENARLERRKATMRSRREGHLKDNAMLGLFQAKRKPEKEVESKTQSDDLHEYLEQKERDFLYNSAFTLQRYKQEKSNAFAVPKNRQEKNNTSATRKKYSGMMSSSISRGKRPSKKNTTSLQGHSSDDLDAIVRRIQAKAREDVRVILRNSTMQEHSPPTMNK